MEIVLLTSVIIDSGNSTKFNYPYKPVRGLGAYQLAWHLRKHNYTVQVIDFIQFFSNEEILKAVDRYVDKTTKVIGVGLLVSPHIKTDLFKKIELLILQIKELYPWVTIVGGGPSASQYNVIFPRKLFNYILPGYAENSMLALCNHIIRNAPLPQFEILTTGDKVIKETVQVTEQFNIETCTHKWDKRDFIQQHESLPLETTRGCIFKCKFCAYPHIGKHKRDFIRSIDCIREELIDNYNNYKTVNYSILDDTFNSDTEKVEEFANMTKTLPFKINYATYLRLDLIEAHRHTEDMLLESGLLAPYFGIESLNPIASKLIGKAFSGKHAREYLPYLLHEVWKDQLLPFNAFIAGLPPETLDDLIETDQWCNDNDIFSWGWNGLGIRIDSPSDHTSEFERNYSNYGFTTIDSAAGQTWKTDYCNGELAQTWAAELNQRSWEKKKLGGFLALERLTLGYSIDNIRNTTYPEWEVDVDLVTKQINWVQQYWNQLMND